ncbi:signal peptidase I [Paenibacillus sp. GSMTC-2017]|uniref:signal peptidase I n=1 Tax=Paenibacillus sp. GSMTC-2017 TaxID=2794350 RepID=UPI0018D71AE8|nr:signal peptidase I [Paenibacillus sp. GSMTC-2017]MBH5316546.1 signal peptidase I [Paenibacillus sp. GSMTC-2017]
MEESTKKKSNWVKEVREWVVSLGVAVVVALLFQNYAYAQTEVYNVSMQNTLVAGQRLIEDKVTYRFNDPAQGDIVIINGPEHEGRIVKRVIALPGQVIDIREGNVFIDGAELHETYSKGETYSGTVEVPYTVPADHVFVLGDNRENSLDSRVFGPVAIDSVEGKAIFRIWPIGKFGKLE